jgi:hypothetical protein
MRLTATGRRTLTTLALALLCTTRLGAPAFAATPIFSEVHTIAAPTTGVPQEFDFSVTTAGNYTVTLTDLGASLNAPLASVGLAVTSGTSLVGTPLTAAGTLSLPKLAAGNYVIHVVGMPGTALGSGPFGVQVNGPGTSQGFQGILALPVQGLPSSEVVVSDTFTPQATGQYTVTLADLQLPQSLSVVALLLIQPGNTTPLASLSNGTSLQAQGVPLTAGVQYDVFAVAETGTADAGLFSAVVTGSGGSIAYGRAFPVGATLLVATPSLAAGSDTLTLGDLQYPAALTQVGAALTLEGQAVTSLSAAGSQPFTATAGTYNVFAVGVPAASPGEGAFSVTITQGGATEFSAARGVTAAGSAVSAYNFDTTITTAGQQTVTLADFQLPAVLASIGLGVEQGGTLLGKLTSATTLNVSASSGPLSLVVFAQETGSDGGLFGIEVAPTAGGSPEFEVTQGVGALFTSQPLPIATAGAYTVTATDLGFPASFANYVTVLTQGPTLVGEITSAGGTDSFNFTAKAGTYTLNFIAEPTGSAQAGTYGLSVAPAPAAPTVSLSSDQSQVSSGSTVNLIWSSQNATSCTASGGAGFSGSQQPSGQFTTSALTQTTTFTLTCTGSGGQAEKSVTVTVSAGSGGGGAVSPELLVLLLGLSLLRVWSARVTQPSESFRKDLVEPRDRLRP